MAIHSYRDLIAWQKGMDLVESIYRCTRLFPNEELYGLTSQIRRAAVSVPSNIAEGHGRGSKQEFHRFLTIAIGSLQEVETQLLLSERLDYTKPTEIDPILELTQELKRIIFGLMKHQR